MSYWTANWQPGMSILASDLNAIPFYQSIGMTELLMSKWSHDQLSGWPFPYSDSVGGQDQYCCFVPTGHYVSPYWLINPTPPDFAKTGQAAPKIDDIPWAIGNDEGLILQMVGVGAHAPDQVNWLAYYAEREELITAADPPDATMDRLDAVYLRLSVTDSPTVKRHFEDAVTRKKTSQDAVVTRATKCEKLYVKGTPHPPANLTQHDLPLAPSPDPAGNWMLYAGIRVRHGTTDLNADDVMDYRVPLGQTVIHLQGKNFGFNNGFATNTTYSYFSQTTKGWTALVGVSGGSPEAMLPFPLHNFQRLMRIELMSGGLYQAKIYWRPIDTGIETVTQSLLPADNAFIGPDRTNRLYNPHGQNYYPIWGNGRSSARAELRTFERRPQCFLRVFGTPSTDPTTLSLIEDIRLYVAGV